MFRLGKNFEFSLVQKLSYLKCPCDRSSLLIREREKIDRLFLYLKFFNTCINQKL